MGRLIAQIYAHIAENESEINSERTRASNAYRYNQVLPRGWKTSIGYKLVGKKKGRQYEDDPVQQAFIDQLAGWYAEGMTADQIHYRLRARYLSGETRGPHVTKKTKNKPQSVVTPSWVRRALIARRNGYPLAGYGGKNLKEAREWAADQRFIPRP